MTDFGTVSELSLHFDDLYKRKCVSILGLKILIFKTKKWYFGPVCK